jgi:hypothetical protein
MKRSKMVKIVFTKSGCVQCEDFRNRKIYENADFTEYSLEDPEGLSLACFYDMWKDDTIKTPALYIGHDKSFDFSAIREYGEGAVEYLKNLATVAAIRKGV